MDVGGESRLDREVCVEDPAHHAVAMRLEERRDARLKVGEANHVRREFVKSTGSLIGTLEGHRG